MSIFREGINCGENGHEWRMVNRHLVGETIAMKPGEREEVLLCCRWCPKHGFAQVTNDVLQALVAGDSFEEARAKVKSAVDSVAAQEKETP